MADTTAKRGVRGSRSGRPIMAVLDLLGRRWMLRILWQLRDGPLTFRALRESCDAVSPSVLNTRLAEMRTAALIETRAAEGYALTRDGERLIAALEPLHGWATAWAAADPGRVRAMTKVSPQPAAMTKVSPRPATAPKVRSRAAATPTVSSRAAAPGAASPPKAAPRPRRSR